jgi:hypothetical protein
VQTADLVWSLVVVLFLVVYFMMLFRVVLDVFRSDDLGGWAKGLWLLALLVVPLLSMLAYVLTRSRGMSGREREQAAMMREAQGASTSVAPTSAAGPGTDAAAEVARARELLASGAITQEEFETLRHRAQDG